MATRGLAAWPLRDAEIAALPDAESLLLDAIRAWAAPGPAGPQGQARLVLAAGGAHAAAAPLDALLRALPGLALGCPLCRRVHGPEASLLLAAACAQQGGRGVALALLASLAPPLAAYRAMPALIHVAAALRGAGLLLRRYDSMG